MINTLSGQVKIGDNPQTLHPASVLELESSTRALVITRVSNIEMNSITPLAGALVYNTDEDCLHYYNGTEWINICETLDNSFTVSTLALHNVTSQDSTVVITQEDTPDGINYNFEVNKIGSDNITNFSVLNSHIAVETITNDKIQNGTITNAKLDKLSIPLSGFGTPLTDVSMGNAARLTNLQNPTAPQDAATKSYVDSEITSNAADGSETIINNGTDINITGNGTAATPYIINSTFSEAQDLADVIANDPSAGNSRITNLQNPTAPQDAATKSYVDSEITSNAADGSETIINNGTDINITGNGTAATPYVINSTFAEAQDLADVIANDPSAGNSVITDVLDPTNAQDAATKAYVDTEITNSAADGSETIINNGTDINITGNGTAATPYVINSTFSEAQDLADVIANDPSAGNSAITDVLDPTNAQDAATKAYVDGINVSQGAGITVTTPAAQDFEVAVTNPVIAIGRIIGGASTPVGATVTNNTGGSYTVNLSATPTNYVVQLTVDNNTGPRTIQLTNQAAASFSVQIYNAGATSDSDWSFTVISF
jgi:hypothetical protein